LRFETWGFQTEYFTEFHKEIAHELGVNGVNKSIDKLKKYNYTINEIRDRDGHDIIATLNASF
jgi:hypothetical protein